MLHTYLPRLYLPICPTNDSFQPGDEIREVNGRRFDCLTHDEAVRVLKYNHRLSLVLRDVGKVPLQQQQQVLGWKISKFQFYRLI